MGEIFITNEIFLYLKYPLFLSNFGRTCIYRQIFTKHQNIKFHDVTLRLKLPDYFYNNSHTRR